MASFAALSGILEEKCGVSVFQVAREEVLSAVLTGPPLSSPVSNALSNGVVPLYSCFYDFDHTLDVPCTGLS